MKHFKMLFCLLLIFTCYLYSKEMNSEQSFKIAQNKLIQLGKNNYSVIDDCYAIENNFSEIYAFVFNLKPVGYIVIASDTNLPPVIAYSFTSKFYDESRDNILENFIRDDLSLRIRNISNIPESIISARSKAWIDLLENNRSNDRFEQWPPEGSTPTGGWLLEQWSQNSPYNSLCPMDLNTGNRSIAGCPSVAMAQILNYHRTTNQVSFDDTDDYYHSFSGNSYWIDNDYVEYNFPSFPELNTFLDTLSDHYLYNNPLTNTDKGAITFACGVAAQQVYSSSGSGTFGVGQAYQAYQKFNFDDVVLKNDSHMDFYEHISQNIKDAIPVHFASITPSGDAGHNFVLDGYNTDEFYHLNMGWGGTFDGWYLLPDEIPYGLTVVEGAVCDIIPIPEPFGFVNGEITLFPTIIDTLNIEITASTPFEEYTFEIFPEEDGSTEYIIELPNGMYDITVHYPDYEIITFENVFVEAYQLTTVDFSLYLLISPTNLEAEINDGSIYLNWDFPLSRPFQYFNIYRKINESSYSLLDTTSYFEYVDIVNPPISMTYGYYIKAIYSQDNESDSSNEIFIEYLVSSNDDHIKPIKRKIYNYPNPFNPQTTIYFETTTFQKTPYIEIFNMKGQKIKKLQNYQKDGENRMSFVWDGTNKENKPVSSGIYMYKLISETYNQNQKMILMK